MAAPAVRDMVAGMEFHDTIPRQVLACVESFNRPDAFRYKHDGAWVGVSHHDVLERVHALALGLRTLNLAKTDRVAILSENRLEWAIADLGILFAGGVTVPIYPTLIPAQVEYILKDADVRFVFVSSKAQAAKIAELRPKLPLLERVVAFDTDAVTDGVESFEELLKLGRALTARVSAKDLAGQVSPTGWASIIYTSGTTGEPKGAILTHKNFMSNVEMCLDAFHIGPADVYLSVLPLSHVFERTVSYTMMTAGVQIAYSEAIETAIVNMKEIHPTVVCLVPRVYEKFYAAIHDAVDKGSPVKRALFKWAERVGTKAVNARLDGHSNAMLQRQHRIAQKLVFKKIQERVGGRLRFFVSGSAPLARNIIEFFHAAGLPILEGYGLTETAPLVAVNTFEHLRFGTVGRPAKGVEVRIEKDGEIGVRGDNVMEGYFKKPKETSEAIIDGWFHTGDIGVIDADGFLAITDRKKDLIATAGGKKMAPQPIEAKLKQNAMIAEAVLVGNRRPYIALLIVPNFARLEAWAASGSAKAADRAALLASPEVHALYQKAVDEVNADLAQFERIKSFALIEDELTAASGDLTPTLKVKRKVVEEKFSDKIDEMYRVKNS
jgi:long-chain acyl-CoA synthetase